jgi:hypothetical protein
VGFRTIDHVERRVIAIVVTPRSDATHGTMLFAGEMELDPETRALVRLHGVLQEAGHRGRLPGLYLLSQPGAIMVDLVNQRLPDGTWVPLEQRFEIESASKRTWGFGSALRVITRFRARRAARPAGGVRG